MESLAWVFDANKETFTNFDTSKICSSKVESADRWPYLERKTFINKAVEHNAYNVIECLFISVSYRDDIKDSRRSALIKSEIFSSILACKNDGYKEVFIKYYNKYYRGSWNMLDLLWNEPELLDYAINNSGYDSDVIYRVLVLACQSNNLEVVKICLNSGLYDYLDMALVQAIQYKN